MYIIAQYNNIVPTHVHYEHRKNKRRPIPVRVVSLCAADEAAYKTKTTGFRMGLETNHNYNNI